MRKLVLILCVALLCGCRCHQSATTSTHVESHATATATIVTVHDTIERERTVYVTKPATDTVTLWDTVKVVERVSVRTKSDLNTTRTDTVFVFDTVTVTQAAATTGDTRHRRQWWKWLTELIGCFVAAFAVVKFGEFFAEILKKSR